MILNATKGIDFAVIRATVRLADIVTADLGPPGKGKRWACPIHGGENPNFAIAPDGKHWKCWSCGASGDVFDYLVAREGITIAEAARRLDPTAGGKTYKPSRKPAAPAPEPPKRPAWEDPAWQEAVDQVVTESEAVLWSKDGRGALDWLRARGLDDATVRRFRLGFNPRQYNTEPLAVLGVDRENRPQGLWVRRGVTIPWVRPGSWYSVADDADGDPGARWVGCNVRRLDAEFGDPDKPKYSALAGSERGHGYPWPDCPAPGEPALVCEGEFDALVAWQEAGWLANVVTFGSAGQKQEPDDARAFLAACPDWALAFDQDDAGDTAARDMARRAPGRCRRLFLPPGVKDLSDLSRGGSVLVWLRSEWERFGWSSTGATTQ
jgi:DNA primase